MRRKVMTALLGLSAVLALAVVGVGAASAQNGSTEADTRYDAWINRVAALLGKQPAQVKSAMTRAGTEQVDQAVQDGDLTAEQAAEIKERIAESGRPFPFFGRHGGFGHRGGLFGEVTEVSGSTLTVETRDGTTKTVKLGGDTQIREQGEEAQASAIAVGELVKVRGEADANGVVAADAVMIGEPRGRDHHHHGPWGVDDDASGDDEDAGAGGT